MTLEEKKAFITQFMDSMKNTFLDKADRLPVVWDGHEIREWMADSFDNKRTDLMKTSRLRRSDVIIKNL